MRFCGHDNKGDNGIANKDGAAIILSITQEKDRIENNSHAPSLALPVEIHASSRPCFLVLSQVRLEL